MSVNAKMKKRVPMRELPPQERIKNFKEVSLGYNEQEAFLEAERCLQCRTAPCISGCPVKIDIPAFISKIRENNIAGAYDIITMANLLPGICGRVCPQESQCEAACIRSVKGEAIAIGRLERYASDNYYRTPQKIDADAGMIAVIGSGPAGLTCGGMLSEIGYNVDIYEALHELGGVLTYGIPEFRLPANIVEKEINKLKEMGVAFHTNVIIGRTITLDELLESHDAVFIGTGAGLPRFMGIPGEQLNGVFSANEFLTRVNLMKANSEHYDTPLKKMKEVIVVGGGNVAMDAARSARRLGADVTVLYRRSIEEMPARREEVQHALQEGVNIRFLVNPISISGKDYYINEVVCVKMELGAADGDGRRRPKVISGSDFKINADALIMALGNYPNPLLSAVTPDLATDKYGCLVVDECLMTSKDRVFAGGDAVTGAATVIMAMEAGKKAAMEIHKYLKKNSKA